jgi:DNA polymerase III alpha subunit
MAADRHAELAWEKELIGLYLSEHPLHRLDAVVADRVTHRIGDLDESMVGHDVRVAGMVSEVRRITTKKGAAMAFARVADLEGAIDLTLFPRAYDATRDLWVDDRLVLLRGKVELRDDRLQILVDEAWDFVALLEPEELQVEAEAAPPEEPGGATASAPATAEAPRPALPEETVAGETPYVLTVTLPRTEDMDADISLLRQVVDTLMSYQGQDRFAVRVRNGTGLVELDFPNSSTRYCVGLVERIEGLVGGGRLQAARRA